MAVDAQFRVGLLASLDLDQGSMARAEKTLDQRLGRKDIGSSLAANLKENTGRIKSALAPAAVKPATDGLGKIRDVVKDGAVKAGHFRAALDGIKRRVTETWHMGGLGRATEQLGEFRKQAGEAGEGIEKLTKLIGPAEGLVGLAGIGGIGSLLEGFAKGGAEIGRTAATIGISTDALQKWRGAAELAGLSADDATGSLAKLARIQHAAKFGLPEGGHAQAAAAKMEIYGSLFGDPEKFLLELSGKVQGKPAQVQRAMVEPFGAEGLLPLLREGPDEVRKRLARAEELRHKKAPALAAAEGLNKSFEEAERATGGFADALGGKLTPTFKPLLDGYTGLLADLKESPGAMDAVTTAAEVLAGMVGLTLVGAVGKAIAAVGRFNLAWAGSVLGSSLLRYLGPVGAFVAALWPSETNKGENEAIKAHPELYPRAPTTNVEQLTPAQAGQLLRDGHNLSPEMRRNLEIRSKGGSATPPPRPGILEQNGIGGGLAPAAYDAIARAEGTFGPAGIDYNKVFGGGTANLTDMSLREVQDYQSLMMNRGSTAVGGFQVLRETLRGAIAGLGLSGETKFTPEVQRQVANWIYRRQGFGAWEGFKTHPEELQRALSATSGNIRPQSALGSGAKSTITDISDRAALGYQQAMSGVEGMVVHHTAGGRTVDDILRVFRQRGVAANFVIDREGNTVRVLPEGIAGRHIKDGWGPMGAGKSNANMEGVEVIAADDRDVNAAQKAAALRLIAERAAKFGYDPATSVFGHGEVNPGHRQESEGMAIVNLVREGALNSAKMPQPGPEHHREAGQSMAEYQPAETGDTHHSVEVRFVDAPQGMRSGLVAGGDGPARLQLRTQFAFSNPS